MRRRILLGVVFVAVASGGLDCLSKPPPPGTTPFFEGCFVGPITEPPGQGTVTVVVEHPGGTALTGCMTGQDRPFTATFAGMVVEDAPTQARVTARQGAREFTMYLVRQPTDGDALTMSVSNDSGMPFSRAPNLPRCGLQRTCADFGIAQTFMPGSAP